MAYNISIKSIQKVKPYLEAMVNSTVSLHWKVPNAKKLAYHIQEALASAKELKVERYSALRGRWRVKYKGLNVTAELLDVGGMIPGSLRFDNMTDSLDIVQTVINYKAVDFELLFPNVLELDNLVKEWCVQNGYDCNLSENGLLISRPEITDGSIHSE